MGSAESAVPSAGRSPKEGPGSALVWPECEALPSALSPPGARWRPLLAWRAAAGPRLLPRPAAAPSAPQGKRGPGHRQHHSAPAPVVSCRKRLCPEALSSFSPGRVPGPCGWSGRRKGLWWKGCRVGLGPRGGYRNHQRPVSSLPPPLPSLWGEAGSDSQCQQELAQPRYWLVPARSHLGAESGGHGVPGKQCWPCAETRKQVAWSGLCPGMLGPGVQPSAPAAVTPTSLPTQPGRGILQQQVRGLGPHPSPHSGA